MLQTLVPVLTVNDVLKSLTRRQTKLPILLWALKEGRECGRLQASGKCLNALFRGGSAVRRFVTSSGVVRTVQMDGYLIDERRLDRIMIQIRDLGGGNLDLSFHERDERYLAQYPVTQCAQWLNEAVLHVESGCPLEAPSGEPAWISDEAAARPEPCIKAMRPARRDTDLPPELEFLRRA